MHRLAIMLLLATTAFGCAADQRETPRSQRRPEAAKRHIERGIDAFDAGDLPRARQAFRRAIRADPRSGLAHNNLGKVLYHQERLYLAARHFEEAGSLMPRRPAPQNNLGLVFEKADKLAEAVEQYEQAVALAPQDVRWLGNLARARLKQGDAGEEVRSLLKKLVMHETRPRWRAWARRRLALLDGPPAAATRPADRPGLTVPGHAGPATQGARQPD